MGDRIEICLCGGAYRGRDVFAGRIADETLGRLDRTRVLHPAKAGEDSDRQDRVKRRAVQLA
jgi:hypothetical protein